ncbi:uncharacterized protein LOC143587487 [Bidens hawaiensis]|uniref:uncharacterized protein LOC143587487 n=1 Tax=Bidens hawaiensis TaxID=980011 RepID=UPI004049F711
MKKPHVFDYFGKNLNPETAFYVVHHMDTKLNNPRLALGFFRYTKNMLNLVHSVETYGLLLRSFCRTGALDLAESVLDLMTADGLIPDSQLLGFVIASFVNAGRFEVAKELIINHAKNSVEKKGVISCFVVNKLLSLLVKNNQVDEAVDMFENVILGSKLYHSDSYTFNIVISGLCKTNNVDKAHALLNKVRSPDVVTFTSVISGYCKLGKMDDVLVLFNSMMGHGIKPNTITFNVIIDGFAKTGNMGSLVNIYEKMVSFNCTPDVITLTSIIDGYCRAGNMHEALKIWDEMGRRNLHPNIYTFNILIHGLCNENRLNEARDVLRQLGKRDDIICKAFVYNPVIDGFCKAGDVDKANIIVKEMEEKRCKLDKITFTILIIGHCMKGRMLEAISLFDKMIIVGCVPDSFTVNSLVSRLIKAGMAKEAFEIRKAASGVRVPQTDVSYSKRVDIPVAV